MTAAITTSQYKLLPGRLRITVKGLRQNPAYACYVVKRLLLNENIWSATANPSTGRALIHFDPAYLGLAEIQLLLAETEKSYHTYKNADHKMTRVDCNTTGELAKAPRTYTLITGFFLIAVLMKRALTGKSIRASSPQLFSIAALVTLISGYPLLHNQIKTAAQKRNINYELILFLPALVLLTLRESIIGLSALWLAQLACWLATAAQENAHKRIYNILLKKQQALENNYELKNLLINESSSSSRAGKWMWWSFTLAGISFFLTRDWMRSLAVLLAGCPAPVFLSQNTALNAAVAKAAGEGVFVKEATALQRLAQVDTVVFDKTGTLTASEPIIAKIIPLAPGYDENKIILLAASSEQSVHHPLANLLLREAQERNLSLLPLKKQTCSEFGVQASAEDQTILVGNRLFMKRKKIATAKATAMILSLEQLGSSILYVADTKQLIGIIGIQDLVKPESYAAISRLRSLAIHNIAVITGDAPPAAQNLTTKLGLTVSWHSMTPEAKASIIKDMQAAGKKVAMVGDGTNDSPAFTASDISIVMGKAGTVQAIDTADIVIANDDPQKVAELIRLSRYANKITQQNLSFATAFNMIGMALAATSRITPVTAGLLLNIVTLAVIINAKSLGPSKKCNNS